MMNNEPTLYKLDFTKDQLARLFDILRAGQNPVVTFSRDQLTMAEEAVEFTQKKFYELELLITEVIGVERAHEYILRSLERTL